MDYESKREKYREISKDIHKNLKPIFERLVGESTKVKDSKSPTDWEQYVPTCGITERNVPLTEEQVRDADAMADQAVISIMENPEDYNEIIGQVPSNQKGQAGSGKGSSQGRTKLSPLEFPEWLEDIESNIKDFFVSKKARKGLDYEEIIKGLIRKPKEKVIQRDDALFVFLDTSGSMWGYVDKYGNSILKLFGSFFPVIAEKYSGQIWLSDYAPYNTPEPISKVYELADFRSDDVNHIVINGKGGTDFWGIWQYFHKQELKIKENNPDAKVMMIFFSDMEADFESHPELIPENVLFVTVKGKGEEVLHLINNEGRKLIFVDAKLPQN